MSPRTSPARSFGAVATGMVFVDPETNWAPNTRNNNNASRAENYQIALPWTRTPESESDASADSHCMGELERAGDWLFRLNPGPHPGPHLPSPKRREAMEKHRVHFASALLSWTPKPIAAPSSYSTRYLQILVRLEPRHVWQYLRLQRSSPHSAPYWSESEGLGRTGVVFWVKLDHDAAACGEPEHNSREPRASSNVRGARGYREKRAPRHYKTSNLYASRASGRALVGETGTGHHRLGREKHRSNSANIGSSIKGGS
ncbi:hypothetical protein HYALB_00001114 [Hymenoscyphus albidus]|uniref:Uncharacterized protein n=1 Tax=Hymenoscyphus albidus TaxID=595503 RepID=A0A9N9LBX0_9HELO|nr:hypothetical protein HYALB_00001114 [Hymenoscyphus albidus]